MFREWEKKLPEVQLYEQVWDGSEEKIRAALEAYHRDLRQRRGFAASRRRDGIYQGGVFMDAAILSGRMNIVELLLELGFPPVFFHGLPFHLDSGVGREHRIRCRPFAEAAVFAFPGFLGSMTGVSNVWPIQSEEMFRRQIEALKDINGEECISWYREIPASWTPGFQIFVTPALFTLLTGDRERLEWLLDKGASLDHCGVVCRTLNLAEGLRAMLEPYCVDHSFTANALEIAILSCNPDMVGLAVEKSREAAFYWSGQDLRYCGRSWYPKPGRRVRPSRCRMGRAVVIATRPMWQLLWGHFQEKLFSVPFLSILDMGAGALADIRLERLEAEGGEQDVRTHMRELESWAARRLHDFERPEYEKELSDYFFRHKDWYKNKWREEYPWLKGLLFLLDLRDYLEFYMENPEEKEQGERRRPCSVWEERSAELYGWGELHVDSLFQWYEYELSLDREEIFLVLETLVREAKERGISLLMSKSSQEKTEYGNDNDREWFDQLLFLLASNETGEDWTERIFESCMEQKGYLPEETVEAFLINGYLTQESFIPFLERLEREGRLELLNQFLLASNRVGLREHGGRMDKAGWKLTREPSSWRWEAEWEGRTKESRLSLYKALRRGKMEKEKELLLKAQDPHSVAEIMAEVRGSQGRFLERYLEVQFWNQAYGFTGFVNLTGLAVLLGSRDLSEQLLAYREELLRNHTNPKSAYFLPENDEIGSALKGSWNLGNYGLSCWRLTPEEKQEKELDKGIRLLEQVSLEPFGTELCYTLTPVGLAVVMGNRELLELFWSRGLLTEKDAARAVPVAGEPWVRDWLLEKKIITKEAADREASDIGFLSRPPERNLTSR